MPTDPLPAFTFPAIDTAGLPRPGSAPTPAAGSDPQAAKPSSVEAVANKPSFSPDEPLPSFTFPALDEQQVKELTQRVMEARAGGTGAALPPPVPPPARVPAGGGIVGRGRELLARLERNKSFARFVELAKSYWRRAKDITRQWIADACTFIDKNRSRLPERLRHALRNVKAGVILAVVAAIVWGVLLVCMILLLGGDRTQAESKSEKPAAAVAPENREDPIQRELDEAKKQGHAALEKLAERRPTSGNVLLELAKSHAAKQNHTAAVATVGKALTADPKLNTDERAAEVLAVAVRQKETTNDAFALLEEPMGAAGATVIYDLSVDPKVKISSRAHAETWIRSARFKEVAEPDVEMAGTLRYTRSCSEKHDLLPRAAEVGEKRTLDYLKIAKVPGGCGRGGRTDCFPCLRKDDALKLAIAAIEKRVADKK